MTKKALGEPVKLRLTAEKELIYQAEAEARGLPFATYLRERLEAQDEVLEELAALRRAIERTSPKPSTEAQENSAMPNVSVMLETLLMLRMIAGPQKTNMVQAELKRLGLSIWDGKEV